MEPVMAANSPLEIRCVVHAASAVKITTPTTESTRSSVELWTRNPLIRNAKKRPQAPMNR